MRVLFVLVLFCGAAAAQPLTLPESETFALDGPAGTYAITVTLPPGYDASSSESHPALYYLDAWWLDELVKGTARVAAISETEIEPVVLVGIGFEGDLDGWVRQRFLDLTPGPYQPPFEASTCPSQESGSTRRTRAGPTIFWPS